MELLTTIAEVRQWRATNRQVPVAACYTMGALHDGHASLMRYARDFIARHHDSECLVVASIFVNPTQFGNAQDLAKYPRTLEADLDVCRAAGVDAVFVPAVEVMYPPNATGDISVEPGPLGDELEGASRPGHFKGVLTVVAKLFHITTPDFAFFGEKDFQQVALIKRMVDELNFPLEVVAAPTSRDHDGLALSSRNARLSDEARLAAHVIPKALEIVRSELTKGKSIHDAIEAASMCIAEEPQVDLDYLVVTDKYLGTPPQSGSARALIAAAVDGVRLIDNIEVKI